MFALEIKLFNPVIQVKSVLTSAVTTSQADIFMKLQQNQLDGFVG